MNRQRGSDREERRRGKGRGVSQRVRYRGEDTEGKIQREET